jgi:hypothetical protein
MFYIIQFNSICCTLYKKIRQGNLTLGMVEEWGGWWAMYQIKPIQFRFPKGTEELYLLNLVHRANVPQKTKGQAFQNFQQILTNFIEYRVQSHPGNRGPN